MTLPLAGVRVLDLSNVLAGPFCAYQLALLGAEVIKVEHPEGGDLARRLGADKGASMRNMGASFVAVNAGKQSITLNLKDPRGKAILRELVKTADVLVENFRPGVMTRLGLDFDALARGESQARVLRDLRLRHGRRVFETPGLRSDHSGHLGCDERDRRCRQRAVARRLSGVRHGGRSHGSVRHLRRAWSMPARADTAACSMSRCWKPRWRRWAGSYRTI